MAHTGALAGDGMPGMDMAHLAVAGAIPFMRVAGMAASTADTGTGTTVAWKAGVVTVMAVVAMADTVIMARAQVA